MPHVIIEYAQDMHIEDTMSELLDAVHQATAATGLFDESHIKLRALPVMHYRVGGEHRHFIHVQLRIHAGRDAAQKQQLSQAVLNAVRNQRLPLAIITVEVVDMDRSSYAKYAP